MSRQLLFTLLSASIVLLSSCLDTEEKIVINKDNSGVYSLTMDMGRFLKMMNQMGKSKDSGTKKPQQKDSIIYFKSFVDTSTRLTQQEKEMLKDGSVHVKVDEIANAMKFVISVPFKNIQDLPYLRENYMKAIDKLNIKDPLSNKEKKEGEENNEEQMHSEMSSGSSSIIPAQDSYTFTAAPGKLSNKFTDKATFEKKVESDSSLQMMKQLTAMMGELTYETTIVLPKPVKHYKGNNPSVSADKKTIVFKNNLSNLLKKPESLEFELDY